MRRLQPPIAAIFCLLVLGSASSTALAATSLTWSGEGLAAMPSWSNGANWAGGTAPVSSSSIGTLAFPTLVPPLTAGDCFGASPTDACYSSVNDLSGLSVNELQLDDADEYHLTGNGLTLGSGGLTTTNYAGSGGFATIDTPLTLSANQTWNVSGSASGGDGVNMRGALSGLGALSVNLSQAGSFGLLSPTASLLDDEVGDVSVTSTDHDRNESLGLGAKLNVTDGHSLSVQGVTFNPDDSSTGPFVSLGSVTNIGTYTYNSALGATTGVSTTFTNASATFDASSLVDIPITGTGTQAGTNYSQLASTGPIELGGATLDVSDNFVGGCPAVPAGQSDTLVTTTGTLTGTFSNAADGSVITTHCLSSQYAAVEGEQFRINYHTTGSPETVTATAIANTPADYTWSGKGTAAADTWSNAANWSGSSAPLASASIGTLSFPTLVPPLTESDCFGATPLDACYASVNDVSGLSVNQLQIAGQGASYTISGQGLTLGSGGLAFTASGGPGVMAKIATPLTLSASQTWDIAGAHGESPDLQVSGQLSGESANLTIDVNSLRRLTLGEPNSPTQADDELGNIVINGTAVETGGASQRTPVELQASVNTTDGHTLTVHNANLGVDGTGPLVATNSIVGLDGSASGPVSFSDSSVFTEQNSYFAPSFSLEGNSSLEFTTGREGTTPGTDYSQVTSSGTVALGGAALELQDKAFDEGAGECSPPVAGRVYTLISAKEITGTFNEVPDGGTAIADCAVFKAGAIVSEQAYAYRINYNLGTSPETVTATSLEAVPVSNEAPTTGGTTNTGGGSGGGSTGAGSGSSPGNTTATISNAQLKASLAGQLTPTGKAASIASLLKGGGYTMPFKALEAGMVTIDWYEVPSGAKPSKATKAKPVLVASGKLVFPAAGTDKVKVRLTAAGKGLLKHAKQLHIEVKATFKGNQGTTSSIIRKFSLER